GGELQALLVGLQGRRIASGRDFDEQTGKLKESAGPPVLLDGKEAQELAANLADATWRVSKVEPRPFSENPPPPFITSTLQQEANRKLGMSSRDTMRVAQALYERGFITYMRTDSTTLSEEALQAARSEIASRYGEEYLSESPRIHHSKVKNAQEAHEAIRPAGDAFRLPDSVRDELDPRELRLYDMIWKRTVAGQMAPARGHRTTVQIEGKEALFQASGKQVEFPGYLRAYVEGSDDPEAELADREKLLPPLKEGDAMTCLALEPQEHVTQPPRRFSEAALIRDLEKEGIGRPSTYANIIETINRRQYVAKRNNVLVPTFTAFAVVQLLEEHFRHLVDLKFTARMEDSLDAISRGEQKALPYLQEFYYGNDEITGLKDLLKADIDPRKACTIPLGEDSQSRPINVRIGKFGPYLERNDERASLPEDLSPDELTVERAVELLEREKVPDVLGSDPASGKNVYLKTGRYGPYFQLGENGETPHIKSLLPGQKPEEVTLTEALRVLSLPRTIGADAATGEDVVVDLGRYGPYVKRGKETRSLSGPDALFSLTLEEAAELFRQEKARRRFGPAPVRELGAHPDSGATVTLMTGRYGPYVTDGETNASIPRTLNPDALTLAEAVTLIQERVAKGPPVKRKPAKAGASRTKGSAKSRRTAPSKESSGAG
ncbi:MAG: type I DNA topoisomerase, partial [SAR324 cluster bacterium]|nr:type I DNA topoisomerase [SAR324 cluster bacterium]